LISFKGGRTYQKYDEVDTWRYCQDGKTQSKYSKEKRLV